MGGERISDGRVVVGTVLPNPNDKTEPIRVIVVSTSRHEAVSRLKALGFHVRLPSNDRPPVQDEVDALLETTSDVLWRPWFSEGA